MKRILLLSTILYSLFSCDVIDKPVQLEEEIIVEYGYCDTTNLNPIYSDTIVNDAFGNLKKILLEDYTGVACGNCPLAASILNDMVTKYGSQIIPIGVHADFFANVVDFHTGYPIDFRTEAGEEYFTFFKVLTNPNGMVNRIPYNGNRVLGMNSWDLAIQTIKDDANIIDLELKNIYNSERRISFLEVKIKFKENSTKKYKLVAHLAENNIISKQANYEVGGDPNYDSPYELDYPHKHVLRSTYENRIWGKDVNSADINAGDEVKISFDKYCVSPDFIDTNCEIIVYIYDDATKEIAQVESIHLRK